MRSGLILPNYGEALAIERLAGAAVAAEQAGFHSDWLTDHLLVPPKHAPINGTIAEALVSLGFLVGPPSIGAWGVGAGRVRGDSLRKIAEDLNDAGVPTA